LTLPRNYPHPLAWVWAWTGLVLRSLTRPRPAFTPATQPPVEPLDEPPPIPDPPRPIQIRWRIEPATGTLDEPAPALLGVVHPVPDPEEFPVQLTADQQVSLSISGEDRYGNPVDITGDTVWTSSDPSIVTVTQAPFNPAAASASAVGPIGTAAITVTNDYDADGTPDFQGSIAIDVVAGTIAEIGITEGAVSDKPITGDSDKDSE
jgi:hypothetical protein